MPFQIVRNDITKMHVDAIVNTANPMPVYGTGTDTAVYEAAGREKLLAKRQEIGAVERGTSVITEGFELPAKYIIHTVGTGWRGGNEGEEAVIRSCYRSVFKLAVDNGIESLAIPLLASGSYGFPKGIALRIALSEIEAFMAGSDMDVYLVVFDEKSFELSTELYGDIDQYINDNYVEEKKREEYAPLYARDACADLTGDARPRDSEERQERGREESPKSAWKDRLPEEMDLRHPQSHAFLTGGAAMAHMSASKLSAADAISRKKAKKRFPEAFEELPASCENTEIPEPSSASMAQRIERPGQPRSLEEVVRNLDKTFMELVFSFADAKGLSDVEVQKRANLDRKAFSKLKCGTTKNPSKATALALAIALELDLDDTKDLLSRAGLALSPCSKQDVIVQYFIERKAYDIYEINVALFEHGEALLGCQAS